MSETQMLYSVYVNDQLIGQVFADWPDGHCVTESSKARFVLATNPVGNNRHKAVRFEDQMNSLEVCAKHFATRAHAGQVRKYTNEPYIVHPASVAEIVRSVEHTPEMLAAAWLHDTVEDCGVTNGEIEVSFGSEVAELVGWLTDVSTKADGNREARKAKDRAHSALSSAAAQTVKVADLIDNSRSIVQHDPDFAKVYLVEKAALLEVLTKADATLLAEARQFVK